MLGRIFWNYYGISRVKKQLSGKMSIESNWLAQESPGLNPDCFGNIRSFSEKKKKRKMKACCYKVTVQAPGEKKLDDNFSYTVFDTFLNVGTRFAFFHSEGNLPERNKFWKILSRGLYIEISQSFNMRMLIMLWPDRLDHELWKGQNFLLTYMYLLL